MEEVGGSGPPVDELAGQPMSGNVKCLVAFPTLSAAFSMESIAYKHITQHANGKPRFK